MLVIADSSALIALSIAHSLEILVKLYKKIIVPVAVYTEVSQFEKEQSLTLSKFLKNKVVTTDLSQFILNVGGLGQGELEAMALYKNQNADLLLIDDRRARLIAEHNDINCTGSLGVLLHAKDKGIINKIKPAVTRLKRSEIYYSSELLQTVLKLANE